MLQIYYWKKLGRIPVPGNMQALFSGGEISFVSFVALSMGAWRNIPP